jgi:hypothetical protein
LSNHLAEVDPALVACLEGGLDDGAGVLVPAGSSPATVCVFKLLRLSKVCWPGPDFAPSFNKMVDERLVDLYIQPHG